MRGRREMVDRLYEHHYRSLLSVAYLLVGAQEADDLVQDAFVRALDHWRPDAAEEAFHSWARTTMARMAISHWRRATRERTAYARHGSTPQVEGHESVPEVARALASLTPRQRTAVILRYYEDLQEKDIAEVMGIRVGTVRALLHQARERLRLEPSLMMN